MGPVQKFLCAIGVHKWKLNRKIHPVDYSPSFSVHETPARECIVCGKKQKWVHGKGAGDMGHWEALN
ncbi:MAG: hypothetical protein Kow0098_01240 [Ignavibacteriaceae bacterium]